jgi:short subunit dehydrogenase-like uncharacterized protein
MVDQFDDVAKVSGAQIVHFCGHDCVPWDLSVLKAARHLKNKGENLVSVTFFSCCNYFSNFKFLDSFL